jgi:hypothetical protein
LVWKITRIEATASMEVTRGRATLVLREKRNPATSSHTKKWKKTMNQSKEKNLRERGGAGERGNNFGEGARRVAKMKPRRGF